MPVETLILEVGVTPSLPLSVRETDVGPEDTSVGTPVVLPGETSAVLLSEEVDVEGGQTPTREDTLVVTADRHREEPGVVTLPLSKTPLHVSSVGVRLREVDVELLVSGLSPRVLRPVVFLVE